MSQAFYRKWRPRTFDEVVGQNHVTQTLHNALKSGRIVHAYLFSGPRGTGKTSTARILAKAVNCLAEAGDKPCNECEMCQAIDEGRAIDLIEIDAASHTGVDDIRALRDKIGFSPSEARYKFYIIDEVHMLSPSAFNALLKTLEEPPPHAILVLATTEPHKIPPTVLSRCQRFDLRPIPLKDMLTRLQRIAAREGLEVHAGALDLIARQSTGSMRDAESLLDQLSSFGGQEITLEQVQTMLGTVSSQAVKDLVDDLAARDVASGLGRIGRTIADGAHPRQLNQELLEYLRSLLLIKTTNLGLSYITPEQQAEMVEQAKKFDLGQLVATIKLFSQAASDLKSTTQPQLPMELAFVEATLPRESDTASRRTASSSPESKPSIPSSAETAVTVSEPTRASSAPAPSSDDKPRPNAILEGRASLGTEGNDPPLARLQNNWTDILASIKRRNMHVEAIIRDCPPAAVDGDVVTLTAASPFHKEKLEDDKAKRLIEDVISETVAHPCRIKCSLPQQVKKQQKPEQRHDLQSLADDYMVKAGLELGGKIGGVE